MRKIHLRLIRDRGLSTVHWELFVNIFEGVLEEVTLPAEQKAKAMEQIRGTLHEFRPIEPGELAAQGLSETPMGSGPVAEGTVASGSAGEGSAGGGGCPFARGGGSGSGGPAANGPLAEGVADGERAVGLVLPA